LTGQVLNYAIRHKYIENNPLSPVERPRGTTEQKGTFLKPEEINRLLTAEKDPMYNVLFKLAIFSGARRGELLGLTWADISFNERQIRIERSYNHGAVYEPKNRTSRRKIDLGEDMMLTLREWRKTNLKSELVFCDKNGKRLVGMTVLNRLRKALKVADLPEDIRFHDLRHTCASLLIHQGENVKVTQTQLGHSTPTQTLNTYSHMMKDSNHDVAGRLENAVLRAGS
jgi:integrase